MESFEDSNCQSMSDSFSLYERYMRSFNIVDNFVEENEHLHPSDGGSSSDGDDDCSNSGGNVDLTDVQATTENQDDLIEPECGSMQPPCDNNIDKTSLSLDAESAKIDSPCTSPAGSSLGQLDTSSAADNCLLTEKSDPPDVRVSSDDSKPEGFKPVFITSTMENSNNAVDSVPLFRDVRPDSIFKLPIRELSFNGTLKHVQKLKPIVDPLSALSTANTVLNLDDKDDQSADSVSDETLNEDVDQMNYLQTNTSDTSDDKSSDMLRHYKTSESNGDSHSEEMTFKKECHRLEEGSSKWNEQSISSLEESFDSGVRSPDMFSDEEEEHISEPFWNFMKDYEINDKRKLKKMEVMLQGVLPPPSVTTLKTDVTEMLKKYYCFLPAFNEPVVVPEENSMTPTKKVSFVHIPPDCVSTHSREDVALYKTSCMELSQFSTIKEILKSDNDHNTSTGDRSIDIKMCTETEAAETLWPNVLKCKYYDVYYNVTSYSEKLEALMQKYRERFVGAETDTSVNIHSGGLQSPSSASKRKAMRLKLAQAKSPGRRLSHLARRRQAFCSAATIGEKAQSSTSRMVLIDKKKLINSSVRKSPRTRRTPGKRTPARKTPGKSTPSKTPKTKSGGSSKKKAMRRLLMDSDTLSKSQPTRETLKRALFVSPENRKCIPAAASTSVPHLAMRSKRALFGSPVRPEETKSLDGTQSDQFLKRKRDPFDDEPNSSRQKIAKSLSFGGDVISVSQPISMNRRASEMLSSRNSAELNETHKKKLLWAVSEALRVHGWRMSSPGFREKASALAQLTRRLLALPPHAARLAAPNLSTSDTMLKIARQYVYAIIQGRTVEECFQDEQIKLANDGNKITGYISAAAYQQIKARQVAPASTFTSQIKENCADGSTKLEPRSVAKNILQDKMVNIDSNSNSSSGLGALDKIGVFKSNSMPSFEEAAKMRARRQISFDNLDFPKR